MKFPLRIIIYTGIVSFFCSLSHAGAGPPSRDSYEILLRSGRFTPDPGLSRAVEVSLESKARVARKRGKTRIHTIIQLDGIPTATQRRALSRQGIELLAYVPNRAWLASIPAERPGELLSLPGVRWVGGLRAEDKLQPEIMAGRPGKWAFDEKSGRIAVLVQLFKDVSLAEGADVVASHGGEVVGMASLINTLVVHMDGKRVGALANEDIVEWVEQPIPPLVAINAENRAIVGADTLQGPSYNLDGSGVDVLIYDGGRAYSHDDLDSHMTYGDTASFSEHATHVACTVGGNGAVTYNNRGMAPVANLLSMGYEWDGQGVFLYTNPGDIEDDLDYAKNTWAPSADLLNASIGTNTDRNGFPCSYEGNYGATAQLLDTIVRGSLGDPFIMAWANGNERGYSRCGTSYDSTAPPACAKNPIQSGATDESDGMSSFSSWGPTDDGRLKPVICAPGVSVLSCDDSNGYTTMSGTSMASPTTTGVIALMLEQYRTTFATSGEFLPSTAKALLIHTAVDLGNTGPDYQYGYGRIDGVAAVDAIIARNFREETLTDQGEVYDYSVTVSGGTPELRASLAWDDPPGTLMAIKKLVNDLDLELVAPDLSVHYPWILDPDNPSAAATTGVDDLNNQEQVVVTSPAAGTWTIRVRASVLAQSPQDYSIVFDGAYSATPNATPGASPTPTATPGYCYGAVSNGGFESGDSPWSWSGSAARSTTYAHGGTYSARVGGTTDGTFYQELTVPSNATGATLTYWVRMQTDETTHPWDFLDVEILDGSGDTLTTLQSLSDGDSSYQGVWTEETFALSSEYAGRTIRVYFQGAVDSWVDTYWYVDDVGLEVCVTSPSPTPTITRTPLAIVPVAVMKNEGGDFNLYAYDAPDGGDWTYWDAFFRNPSMLARDLWAVPARNDASVMAEVIIPGTLEQGLSVVKAYGGIDQNLYLYNVPVEGDWSYWDAASRNPSAAARDLWVIPSRNGVALMADADEYLAVMKNDEEDYNLYLYNVPRPGDWMYWDAVARNPSAAARDLWVIPYANDAVAVCGLGTTGDGAADSLVAVRDVSGEHRLYLWNMPVAGDWTYADAIARNLVPRAHDRWVVPRRNDIGLVTGVNRGNTFDELAVVENEGGDYTLYLWNAPRPGDLTEAQALARNPSALARDFWVIPAGNDTAGLCGLRR